MTKTSRPANAGSGGGSVASNFRCLAAPRKLLRLAQRFKGRNARRYEHEARRFALAEKGGDE